MYLASEPCLLLAVEKGVQQDCAGVGRMLRIGGSTNIQTLGELGKK
jgi:hypothetical protein